MRRKNEIFILFIIWLLSIILIGILGFVGKKLSAASQAQPAKEFPSPKIPFRPPHYIIYRASEPIAIDGKLDEPAWKKAAWTEKFMDIEADLKPKPRFRTQVKMLWDDNYLYFGAELEEPDVWATLTTRDSIIYLDNDFEVFIDPDGDSHEYYELEMNVFGTEWDLLLVRPYRDGGPAVHSWDIQGLKTKVFVDGTINKPGDKDKGWSVEIAMPWDVLKECIPGKKRLPAAGDQWRVNFSRVEYQVEVKDGKYFKVMDQKKGKPLPEDNWTWAPQGLINIHYPEMWAFVQFSDKPAGIGKDAFLLKPEEMAKWALRQVYYREKTYFLNNNRYTDNIHDLNLPEIKVEGFKWPPQIKSTWNLWEAFLESDNSLTKVFIRQDGRTTIFKEK